MLAGIDWASEEHAVCVLDDEGRVVDFTVRHSAEGFDRLTARLARHGEPAGLPVAIERPDGRLDGRLLEAGHPVVPVKTHASKAWREAEVLSGAKSDPGDAEVIAGFLRQRRGRLRQLLPFSSETRALRAVVRSRIDLIEQRVAAANQLEAVLDAFWPGAKAVFADIWTPITAHLDEHPDAEIFRSLPRSGQINAAQMLAEWGDCREAFDTPEAVAALCGATPVTKWSGKHEAVHFRWACNKRFRNAMSTFADNSRRASPWAQTIYQAALDRGHDHPHAVRILARAWIRVIYRCWIDHSPYDPARHGAITRAEQTTAA